MSEIDYAKLAAEMIKMQEQQKDEQPWKNKLIVDSKGKVMNHIDNYLLYFSENEKYKGKLFYNEYTQAKEFDGKEWDSDFDEAIAIGDIEHDIQLSSKEKTKNALSIIFSKNMYNPIQDYIKSLKWDGEERIETVFIKLLEADDTPINREMSKKWLMAAVKRTMFPGCKFDNMLIFQGAQGIGKTTICERLAKGFSSVMQLSEISSKDIINKMNKTWICIIDEMDAFNKKDMTTVKTFLSTCKDTARLSWGHDAKYYYRHCVFIGSTNDCTFLRDSTSSVERRFWIIKSNRQKYDPIVNNILTDEYVDQIWAEAYQKLMENPNQYLDIDFNLSKDFADAQQEFKTYNNDVVIDYVKDILDKPYLLDERGEFSDNNDFLRQYRGETSYVGTKSYINKIPAAWVMSVLKDVYKDTRAAKYISLAISKEWEYKIIKYKNTTYWGWYRKLKKTEYVDENENQNTTLPF